MRESHQRGRHQEATHRGIIITVIIDIIVIIIQARLSFLSGHSSFSFFCGMFLIIYLQARLNNMPYIENTPVRICYRSELQGKLQ